MLPRNISFPGGNFIGGLDEPGQPMPLKMSHFIGLYKLGAVQVLVLVQRSVRGQITRVRTVPIRSPCFYSISRSGTDCIVRKDPRNVSRGLRGL